jgi:hypothetical protein
VEYVWHLVTTVLVGVAILLARDALGSRRRRQHALGARVRCPGRLGLGGDRPRRGHLELAGSGIRWTGGPADPPVVLTGAVVLAHTPDAPARRLQDEADEGLLHLALPTGRTAVLRLRTRDVPTVAAALASDAPDGLSPLRGRRAGIRRWALVSLVLGAAWVLACCWSLLGRDTVEATVTGPGSQSGFCQARWPTPGGGEDSDEVTCDDLPVGTRMTLWLTGPPLEDPGEPSWTVISMVLVAAVVGGPGAVHAARRLRRQRTTAATPVPWAALRVDHPQLTWVDLVAGPGEDAADVARRLSPFGLRRTPPGAWESARRAAGARVPGAPRRLATTLWSPWTGTGLAVAGTSAAAGSGGLAAWGLLLAGALTAWRVPRAVDTWRQTVAVHAAARVPPVPAPGLLTATAAGGPLVLLAGFHGNALAVPLLEPLPAGTVAAFVAGAGADLRVRGPATPGEVCVLQLPDGRLLLPAGRAEVLDRPALHAALAVPDLLPTADEWDDDEDDPRPTR